MEASAERSRAAWDPQALQRALAPVLPGIEVEVLERVDSTNTQLLEALRGSSAPAPRLLVAESQTAGRGRAGRRWHSRTGDSLTFSLGLTLAPRDWSGLSLAVGVALAEALEPRADPASPTARVALKWPNDLWLREGPGRGRKLGGVLLETVAVARARAVVIGVGLNVQPLPDEGFATGMASLSELDPAATAPQVLACVALPLALAVRRFEREGLEPFAQAFAGRDLLRGQRVRTTLPSAAEGTALGITADGRLRVRTDEGVEHPIASGDVSVRIDEAQPC